MSAVRDSAERAASDRRVIRIISRLNMGGPARHTVLADAGLGARGFDTLLVHGSIGPDEESFEHLARLEGVPTRRVDSLGRRLHAWDDVRAFLALFRIVRSVRPDVVHTHTAKAGALGRLAAAVYNATVPKARRCVIIHTFHGHVLEGYFSPVGSRAARAAERMLSAVTDCTIAISPRQREDLITRFHVARPDRTEVVRLGLRLDDLFALPPHQLDDSAARAFNIGYVGRLVPIKHVAALIRAVAIVRDEIPQARLLVTGDGPERGSLESLAREIGVADIVAFHGWQHDLSATYGQLDVLALTSKNEGTPVAIIEAMAAGVPVVAPAVGGIPDVVTNGMTGLLTDGSPESTASAIIRIARDREFAVECSARARQLVRSEYSEFALVDRLAALYERLLSRKRTRSNEPGTLARRNA